jgi:hypothetical protein
LRASKRKEDKKGEYECKLRIHFSKVGLYSWTKMLMNKKLPNRSPKFNKNSTSRLEDFSNTEVRRIQGVSESLSRLSPAQKAVLVVRHEEVKHSAIKKGKIVTKAVLLKKRQRSKNVFRSFLKRFFLCFQNVPRDFIEKIIFDF